MCLIPATVSIYFNLKLNWDQDPNHKTLQAIEHSATACLLLVSNHVVCPSTFGHFFSENFKRPIPALKISDIMIHKDLLRPSTTQHPKDSQSTAENHLPMYEPLPSPGQSHSQNDPKTLPGPRPPLLARSTVAPAEISCSTMAAWGFPAAQCSAVSPRAPRMRGGRRGSCRCRRETRRSNGMFLQVVGQNSEYRS